MGAYMTCGLFSLARAFIRSFMLVCAREDVCECVCVFVCVCVCVCMCVCVCVCVFVCV